MKHRDQILKLHSEGKSRKEIIQTLGCTSSTVCYHLSQGQKRKTTIRRRKSRSAHHPFVAKLDQFKYVKPNTNVLKVGSSPVRNIIYQKIRRFHQFQNGASMSNATFTIEDVIKKFGENPKCYLTGQAIDIQQPRTYQFDHIIPVSRGGSNDIDNLGLCTRDANQAKNDMTPEEFYSLCLSVVKNLMPPLGNDPRMVG